MGQSNRTARARPAMDRLVDRAVQDVAEQQAGLLAGKFVGDRPGPARSGGGGGEDQAFAALQDILLSSERDRIHLLNRDVQALRHQIDDKQALATAIAPILGDAIRRQIRESREEIIDALYPIIGQLVVRAVTEAMRDLARSIDEKLQAATDFQRLTRRLRSLATGVPVGELALREGMPLLVHEVYLIHRESGLLLWHGSTGRQDGADSELVGSMLTAIRDFAEQVIGGVGKELNELRFGNSEIVLEFGRYSYAALIIDGVTPSNLRWKLHRQIYTFEDRTQDQLSRYDGDASVFAASARRLFESFLSIAPERAE